VKPPHTWLETRIASTPTAIALEFGEEQISFAELGARVRKLAGRLHERGVRAGQRIAGLLPSSPAQVELMHAAQHCGAVWLPLNLRLAQPELVWQLHDSEPQLLVHDGAEFAERARRAAHEAGTPALSWETLLHAEATTTFQPRGGRESDPADFPMTLIYTSGTSGRPKGACLGAKALFASAKASTRHIGSRVSDRWLACMPLFHVGGLSILLRSVFDGTPVVLQPRFDANAVNRALDEQRISLFSLTPTMLRRLLDARGSRSAPETLRCLLLGGGPCPRDLRVRAQRQGFPLAPTYGLTETCSQVATRRPEESEGPPDALTPLPGVQLRIVDSARQPLAADQVGEIEVRSPTLMQGYWRQPPRSAQTLAEGWLRTGDAGSLDPAGRLHVYDRRSDLILSGGENIYPREVERVLELHPDVSEVGVAGVPDADFGERPCAWWVAGPGTAVPDDDTLRAHCLEHLAGYKVPLSFWRVEALPRTPAGKLLRRKLSDLGAASADNGKRR